MHDIQADEDRVAVKGLRGRVSRDKRYDIFNGGVEAGSSALTSQSEKLTPFGAASFLAQPKEICCDYGYEGNDVPNWFTKRAASAVVSSRPPSQTDSAER